MSYNAPAPDAVTASWAGASAYTAPASDAVTASWFVVFLSSGIVYRATVDSVPPLVLPIASLQCTRRLGSSTWMVLRSPWWSLMLESDLVFAIGATVRVERGDGTQWAEFLDAVLTDISTTVTAESGEISLTGRVQTPNYTLRTRTLNSIETLQIDNNRRKVRCTVDHQLRPNDIVDDGFDTWTAGIIFYSIDASREWMDVTEDA